MVVNKIILICSLLAVSISTVASASQSCLETAMTQTDMNLCAGVGFQEADAELNRVYKKIREIYKDESSLRITWMRYRAPFM